MNSRRNFLCNLPKVAAIAAVPLATKAIELPSTPKEFTLYKVISTHKSSGYTITAGRFDTKAKADKFITNMYSLETKYAKEHLNEYTIVECLASKLDEEYMSQ